LGRKTWEAIMLDFTQVANGKSKPKKVTKQLITIPAIEPIQKELEVYKPKLAELEKQAQELKVTGQETFQASIDGAATAKGLVKAIDGRKAEITNPYREFVNKVNNLAKVFTEPLKRVATEFSRKSGDYQYQQDLARKKQEKAIEEANRKLQEDLNKQAKKDGVEAPIVTPVKPQKPETTIHTAGGHSQHLRKDWVAEIEEPKKVPREYLVPDQKLINQAVKMGVREIPGVKIFQKIIPVHR